MNGCKRGQTNYPKYMFQMKQTPNDRIARHSGRDIRETYRFGWCYCKGILYIYLHKDVFFYCFSSAHRVATSNNWYWYSTKRCRWRSGLARLQQWSYYLQGPRFKPHLWPVEFFSCKKVSPLPQSNPNANIYAVEQYEKHAFCHWYWITTINKIKKKHGSH